MYDLPTTLSKFLGLGLSLEQVIARATLHPAKAMRRPDLGTLSVGAPADIALFRLEQRDQLLHDVDMRPRTIDRHLINTATFVAGHRLPERPERPSAPWAIRDLPPAQRAQLQLGS